METAIAWVLGVGAVCIALIAIGKVVRSLYIEVTTEWKKLKEVIESYLGRPETRYYDAEPGIPERMATNETVLASIKAQIDINAQRLFIIEKQVFPDHGNSLADDLKAIKTDLEDAAKERNSVLKASNKMRDQWAERLGVTDLPDPPELRKYDSL